MVRSAICLDPYNAVHNASNKHYVKKQLEGESEETATRSFNRARAEFSDLTRHIFGNFFRPYPAPPSWPSAVVQLASAMYEGQPCSFALHDALLEAGHSELAEHFKEEAWHPKGCWVLDVILGKK